MDESRKAFEQWYLLNWGHTEDNLGSLFDIDTDYDCYYRLGVRMAYEAWQASRAAIEIKFPDIYQYLAELDNKTLSLAFCRLAEGVRAGDVATIRAAGIKVKE